MDIVTISVIGGFTVSVVTIISSLLIAWLNKHYELKREMSSTIYNIAYKEWEAKTKQVLELVNTKGGQAMLYPFDEYLFYYKRLMTLLYKGKIKEGDIKKIL